ncbi:related to MAP kinase pathway-interacting Ubc2 [Rhynchosporium agropyri]|uniref:Related to MAP kinase pathway-interacting Ubc2 n=2 Tax=Rhynchosporium TaxID=38037 RepID=A0A1E1LVA8_RHYSE|nr:related to MAP kinase pathway-interacting Ubc2 [Rhynchosporium agropyri]CZT40798.1 related to MAP kinase pathway-interacting Ubc2 [Rhynchosporium secalis]
MAFSSGTAMYPESDADDEYERSVHDSSPILATDSEATDSNPSSNEHTPTTYGAPGSADRLPETIITEWTADECADFVGSLGLQQYVDQFLENEIVGEALVALQHDDLKQMGVTSVGHRLTILKSVYDIKTKQDIPLESDHYVPLSADAEAQYATATLKDIRHLVEQLRLRDERMSIAEMELRRITADYARLREDLLPVFRMAKEGQPLPYLASESNNQASYPYDTQNILSPPAPTPSSIQSGGGLSRKFSTKKLFFDNQKTSSPTYMPTTQERILMEQALDPANAAERAVLSSSHLAALNGGSQPSTSPGYPSPNQPSPTSPPTLGSTLASRSYRSDQPTPARSTFQQDNDQYQGSTYSRDSQKLAPSRRAPTPALDTSSSNGSVEIFKSFRVSMEDPCYKVLPAALKKYNINAPWEQYALYIVYGDKERCLGMEEKPLILFKQLDKEGKKPMFMLRKISSNADVSQPDGPGSAGLNLGRGMQAGYDPPGGII